jgi:SAM-dependent methyltransferase
LCLIGASPEQRLSKPLEFTGERFTPECVREIWYEHVHRYTFASDLVGGKKVLDAACGEGYGAAHLARTAESVIAVDISDRAIAHAQDRYPAENLQFCVADCCDLPFEDNQFDCIVSFETLEHLEDQSGLLREFRRVLDPGGFLVISSPDKAIYTDRYHTDNEFHVRELYREELDELLDEQFPARNFLSQKLLFHSAIWSRDAESGCVLHQSGEQEISTRNEPGHEGMYYIVVCAADQEYLPRLEHNLWLFDDQAESVYAHYHHEIRKNMSAGNLLAAKEQELQQLRTELAKHISRPAESASWWRRLFGKP